MYLPILKVYFKKKKKKKKRQRTYQIMLMRCFFFLIFFIKAYVVGTHLNCIDKLMQFKWVPTTYLYEVDKNTLAVI